jgi:hypothetical protein
MMPGNPREMITVAERRFPVRIRIGVPPEGLGHRYTGTRGALNDAVSIYFPDATLASAFVARWCLVAKVVTAGGVFQVREDEPEPRVGTGVHRTP